jgi:hypothetical protein
MSSTAAARTWIEVPASALGAGRRFIDQEIEDAGVVVSL